MSSDRFGPLISPAELAARVAAGTPTRIVDVRWRLGQPAHGPRAFAEGRIPGAVFLDLDRDLSQIDDPARGRHPLPEPETAAARLAAVGLDRHTPVVVYDDLGGAVAARLWWMLGWLGGPPVAVLDGGLDGWCSAGQPLRRGPATSPIPASPWAPSVDAARVVDIEAIAAGVPLLIDARSAERYRGETEPVDPQAGHIPGAVNAPWAGNLVDWRMADPAILRARFEALGVSPSNPAVFYCGSGVTACHDLLALDVAGLRGGRLFPGSWSAWCHRPGAPIATGPSAG